MDLGPNLPLLVVGASASAACFSASCFSAEATAFFKASTFSDNSEDDVAGGSACCRELHCFLCLASLLVPEVVPDPATLPLLLLSAMVFSNLGSNKFQVFSNPLQGFFSNLRTELFQVQWGKAFSSQTANGAILEPPTYIQKSFV